MEEKHIPKIEDRNILVLMHLSQLINYVTGFGGLIAPLIIWVVKKDTIQDLDYQGKEIINFQITLLLAAIVCIPLCFIFIGFILLLALAIVGIAVPIIQALKAKDGNFERYPMTIRFIK